MRGQKYLAARVQYADDDEKCTGARGVTFQLFGIVTTLANFTSRYELILLTARLNTICDARWVTHTAKPKSAVYQSNCFQIDINNWSSWCMQSEHNCQIGRSTATAHICLPLIGCMEKQPESPASANYKVGVPGWERSYFKTALSFNQAIQPLMKYNNFVQLTTALFQTTVVSEHPDCLHMGQ